MKENRECYSSIKIDKRGYKRVHIPQEVAEDIKEGNEVKWFKKDGKIFAEVVE